MKEFNLKGTKRSELGRKATRLLRRAGGVPCNLYGESKDENGKPTSLPFSTTNPELRNLIYTPDIFVVNLDIDGEIHKAVMREIQFHPVKDTVLHVDFYEITDTKLIEMDVPIRLNGLAAGVKAGGRLVATVRKLKVKAVHSNIPERLDIDVTNLGLGKTIKAGELHFEGLELVTSKDVVVCQVKMTRGAIAAASTAAAANS